MSPRDDSRDELARELRDRSHDVGGHPIAFESVRRSARSIQLRRRIAGGAAAVAVLAVGVPAGRAASDTLDLGQQPAGKTTPTTVVTTPDDPTTTGVVSTPPTDSATELTSSPSTSGGTAETSDSLPTQATTAQPSVGGPVDLSSAGAVRGADPAIAFLDGQALTLPGREPLDLGADYSSIAPHKDGWIAIGIDGGGNPRLFFLAADGTVQDSMPSPAYDIAVSAAGDKVLYATTSTSGNRELNVAPTSGSGRTETFPLNATGQITSMGISTGTGTLYFNTGGGRQQAWSYDEAQGAAPLLSFRSLTGVSPDGALAGTVSISDTGSCSQVRERDSTTKRWETCDYALGRFSPDSRSLWATNYYDGLGASEVAILDAETGEVIVSYLRPTGSSLVVQPNAVAWEGASHVLASVYEDGAWRVLRLGLDGTIEITSRAVKADELSNPFVFADQP